MDSEPKKFYHRDPFDSEAFHKTYFSDEPDMVFGDDSMKFPMMNCHYVFSSGFVKGDVLIDLSSASLIHHLYSACDVFKDIIILKVNDNCKMETSKWKDSQSGAYSWKHASNHANKLAGKSDQFQDKDEQLKMAISQILPCDFKNEDITYPVELPLADCITSIYLMNAINKDEDECMRNLEKMSKLLKPGGHMILVGILNMSYYTVGEEKYHSFKFDESFMKNALSKQGYVIDYCAVQRRRSDSKILDYGGVMFITACKTK
ncbi:indolethylamine N-methyltransferase-like [Hyperolius riggenbachi]|uniref:indolethylamine N-methyltransferase-like n=1 Tax=Hyperolius riggenbachi TaxID=752182 RepID=UPI0035A2ACF6